MEVFRTLDTFATNVYRDGWHTGVVSTTRGTNVICLLLSYSIHAVTYRWRPLTGEQQSVRQRIAKAIAKAQSLADLYVRRRLRQTVKLPSCDRIGEISKIGIKTRTDRTAGGSDRRVLEQSRSVCSHLFRAHCADSCHHSAAAAAAAAAVYV